MDTATTPPPILQQADGPVQSVLTCSLCCEIPVLPVVTSCQHVFCRPCILQALQVRNECPNDRSPLDPSGIQPISGPLKRIWEQVAVKCPASECSWTGTLGSYKAHADRCSQFASPLTSQMVQYYEDEITRLKGRVTELERDQNMRDQVIVGFYQQMERLTAQIAHSPTRAVDTNYRYDRHYVVELSQLICQNLENKPAGIDSNRLYNCIRSIYQDYTMGFRDNPEHFHVDVRMLINICRSTGGWFTGKQLENFHGWARDSDFGS